MSKKMVKEDIELPTLKSKDKIKRIASNLDEKEKEMVKTHFLIFR